MMNWNPIVDAPRDGTLIIGTWRSLGYEAVLYYGPGFNGGNRYQREPTWRDALNGETLGTPDFWKPYHGPKEQWDPEQRWQERD